MDASTPRSPAQRLVSQAPWAVLALGMLVHAWLAVQWLGYDLRVGEPVVCEAVWPVNELITVVYAGRLGVESPSLPGLVSWLGLAGHSLFGGGGRALLLTMLVCLMGSQLLAFDIGRLLGDRWTGVLAALLLPLFPDIALLGRRWGPILPQLLLLLALADLLLRSRSFSRLHLALGVGLVGAVGAMFSPFSTHDLLFLGAAGSMCGAAALRGLVLARPPGPGEPVSRLRVAAGVLLAAAPMAAAAVYLVKYHTVTDYYAAEANAEGYARAGQVWQAWFLMAYLRQVVTSSAGPLLAGAFGLGLVGFLWRGRGRAELVLWVLGPLVALSLIAKKNWYYAAVIFPVLPIVIALGLRALPWRAARAAVGVLLVVFAASGWWLSSFGDGEAPAWYRNAGPDPAFQSPPGVSMLPQPHFRWSRHEALLRQVLRGSSCPAGASLGMMPDAQVHDLVFALKTLDPCLGTHPWSVSPEFDWLIVTEHHCSPQPESVPGPVAEDQRRPSAVSSCEHQGRCVLEGADLTQAPCLWLTRTITAPDTP